MMAVIELHPSRVIQRKNGGVAYPIPFELTFRYTHPQVDKVPFQQLVDVTALPMKVDRSIQTMAEAIDVYLAACEQQFAGKNHLARKRTCLQRFVAHLATRQHCLSLADLTLADGQQFLATVVNAPDGMPLSPSIRQEYKSALRTFSRFLHQVGLTATDIFFQLRIE